MNRQRGSGAPSAPTPPHSPSALQPPPIIVLPNEESCGSKVSLISHPYEQQSENASRESSSKGTYRSY